MKRKRCIVSHPVPVAPFVVWYQIIRRFCHPLSAREKLKRRVTVIDWVDSLRILNTLNCFVCFRSNFPSLSFHFLLDRRPESLYSSTSLCHFLSFLSIPPLRISPANRYHADVSPLPPSIAPLSWSFPSAALNVEPCRLTAINALTVTPQAQRSLKKVQAV